jgi:hypothetical protein
MTMTDNQAVSIIEQLRGLANQVKQIDAELGTDVSGPIAARNKIANEYVARYNTPNIVTQADGTEKDENNFTRFISQVVGSVASISGSDEEMMVALYTELGNSLQKRYGDTVKNHLQKIVDAQPKSDAPTISDARKIELANERSKAVNLFKLQKEMLKYISSTPVELPSDIEEPSARRGSIGPRGAQFTKTYQYSINGKLQEMTDSEGVKSLATLSNLVLSKWAKDLGWKTKDLRDYIIEQTGATVNKEENTVELPDTWSVTLPSPHQDKVLGAELVTASNANVSEAPDDEDDTNGETGEEPENAFASA